jgi:hypothetical protein
MSTATLTEADNRVRDAVQRQSEWDPSVDASAVGAAAVKCVRGARANEAAEDTAAQAPGISRVDNRIVVEPRERVDELC